MKSSGYRTFRAFKPHFDALARVGYFKLLDTHSSRSKVMFHNCYRVFIWAFVLTYNLQHLIIVIQSRHSIEKMVDVLFILLTTLNTLGKQVAFNARVNRVERIIDVINGSHFAPYNAEHIKILKRNEKSMAKLLYLFQSMVISACISLVAHSVVNKVAGKEMQIMAYFPFDISISPYSDIAFWYLAFNLTYQACGNGTMDCTIAAFYAMAKTQLSLLRYDLEHLVDEDDEPNPRKRGLVYSDSKVIQKRLEKCVKHHRQILWFVNEVESIFCESITVQFLIMAWVICMIMYKLVGLRISAELWSMIMYLNCMLSQLFIYCYYGSQVRVESEFVSQSIYQSDWTRLSPSFRRQLLVLMQCSSRPIVPCAAKMVPISLETYIVVLRAAYTLFTIL